MAQGLPCPARSIAGSPGDVALLRTTDTIRSRCAALLQRARDGRSDRFAVDDAKLGDVVELVVETFSGCPSRGTAVHGRMRHFDAGGVKRCEELERMLAVLDREERARVKIDLLVPSVLLDAGAGPAWRYRDGAVTLSRSEGLAVATYRMFVAGMFAGDKTLRTDAAGLAGISEDALASGFQVSADNPIVGLAGRAHVLRELSAALWSDKEHFGSDARPGHLFDWAKRRSERGRIDARDLLGALLATLSSIWPGRVVVGGQNVGDVWPHPALGDGVDALVPFHKLSQWLTYSLVEPLIEGGLEVVNLEGLTALSEYRNGGLLLDAGALRLRDERETEHLHRVEEPLVVEWRALTVGLLAEVTPCIRRRIGASSCGPAVAAAIEGATWLAGRTIAAQKRTGGAPPLQIESDGTVF